MPNKIARVYMLDIAYHIDKLYDYKIPESIADDVKEGDIVALPFGQGNRNRQAVVWSFADSSEYKSLKSVSALCGLSLSREMMELCRYMKEHFFCSIGEAARTMVPTFVIPLLKEYFSPSGNDAEGLTAAEKRVRDYIGRNGRTEADAAVKALALGDRSCLYSLERKGVLVKDVAVSDRRIPKNETVSLIGAYAEKDGEELAGLVRGERQKELLRTLAVSGEESMAYLRENGFSKETVLSLAKQGYVTVTSEEAPRDPYTALDGEGRMPTLSNKQREAADEIGKIAESGKAGAALLYGVTGSGKTSVIGEVIDRTIKSGKQVILLVPEISLTPQTVGIFYNRYRGRVAVLHSGLSDGERYDAWKSIRDGKKDMVIGTRSAVFAPFPNLGLIVLDEEHEHSYKSESSPRYHARDIARFRCAATGSTLLLASATPSLESFSKAKEGKYKLVTLSERFGEASLPEIVISDMRGSNSLTPIGDKLYASLSNVLARNEQAILFINRRGYNNFLSCPVCGKAVSCPHCSVSYTYHSFRNNYNRGYLYCHYCGNKEQAPSKCPSCGNDTLTHVGFGTQMIEEELNRLFPSARVLRMDSDSMSGKMSYDALLGSFRRREADILVGTQMVTKGHDFPDVTLVGVINADGAIYQSSYSASERAFSLFTQVIGRAGRAKKHGQALLQTYSPDFPLFGLVAEGNYEKMYDEEIALRRALSFPPFCNLAVISMSSTEEGLLLDSAHSLAAEIRKEKTIPMTVFGPIDAPIYKINGVYHTQIVIKCVMNAAMRSFLAEKYAEATEKNGSKISVSLDVDPMNL